ncbi:MAG: hypothetical protein ACTHN5_10305, partial [Phycisphaerae bacterium]
AGGRGRRRRGLGGLGRVRGGGAGGARGVTLFLMGAGLSRKAIAAVGVRPLVLGVVLWVVIGVGSLGVIVGVGR